MAKPFPDMPYWGAFPAMGPIPSGKASDPAKYALHPWATGPYMFDEYTPEKSLTLVKNPNWDPNTDPGRHQYVDEYDMKFDVPSAKIDQISLNDEGEGQTTSDLRQHPGVELRHGQAGRQRPAGPRLLAVLVLLGAGLPQDHRHRGPQGARLRVPVPGGLGRRW